MGEKPCGDVQELARQGMPDGDRHAQTHRRGQEGATPLRRCRQQLRCSRTEGRPFCRPAQAIALGISSLEEMSDAELLTIAALACRGPGRRASLMFRRPGLFPSNRAALLAPRLLTISLLLIGLGVVIRIFF